MICPRCGMLIFGFPVETRKTRCRNCDHIVIFRDYVTGLHPEKASQKSLLNEHYYRFLLNAFRRPQRKEIWF